jgi:TolB-like protein
MPDIFLSYNREDQATARRFAEAFQLEGFDVWWDTTLRAGEAYDEVTEAALNEAKAVVVLWSPRSAASRWVRAEATQADRNKTLVPVTIEACKRPIMFELTQTADLTHWDGSTGDNAWVAFLSDVRRLVEASAARSAPAPRPAARIAEPPAVSRGLSICVLPFANMSADPEQEYFSDGISEDIITDLSKVSALGVIARNSAFAFKGRTVDITQVARQLGVTHVLEGSVRKAGSRVRITAQLIGGSTNEHVWAERWDRDLDDIFALQDEISQAIVGALKLKLLPEEKRAIEDRGTTNLEAYDKYLRARALFNQALTIADLLRAADLHREVLAIDPDCAAARGGVAQIFSWVASYAPEEFGRILADLETVVREGLERTPEHWGTQAANALLLSLRRDWPAAIAAFEKACAAAPPSETAIPPVFALMGLGTVGRIDDGVRLLESACRSDPLDRNLSNILQHISYIAGRADESQAEYQRTLELSGHREAQEHIALFRTWDLGDHERTRVQFRRYLASQAIPMPVMARIFEVFDQSAAALSLLSEAFEDPANQDGTRLSIIGWYAGRFGDADLAVAALRRATIDFRSVIAATIWYPFLAGARKTSAFKQLIRDLGISDYWRQSGNWGDFARPVGDDDFEIIR